MHTNLKKFMGTSLFKELDHFYSKILSFQNLWTGEYTE